GHWRGLQAARPAHVSVMFKSDGCPGRARPRRSGACFWLRSRSRRTAPVIAGRAWHRGRDPYSVRETPSRGSVPMPDTANERFDLGGRVVVITGGGKGIGKVYAREFARAGARVVAADIDGAAAEAVAAEIGTHGGEALALATDIAEGSSVEAMAAAALGRFGAIDVLVNNASLMSVL